MAKIDLSSSIEMATRSDPGKVRSNNEDAVLANASLGLAVLADGMGGHNAGEVASGMATAVLGSELEQAFSIRPPEAIDGNGQDWMRNLLADVIGRTNNVIYLASQRNPKFSGMGTTLVMAYFFDDRLMVAHVGDSRLYRLRGDKLEQLTRDHSLLQDQIDSGMITPEQARFSQNRNLVTRAMGVEPTLETDIGEHRALLGDVYLLCSDGLNDMVEDGDIASILQESSANLPLCANRLVKMANDNGGKDNVSVILVKVNSPFPAAGTPAGWMERVQSWFN
jgi:PPM family protein phosphatase